MSSVQSRYAQRNNNNIQVIPEYVSNTTAAGVFLDFSDVATYVIPMPDVQNSGGIFYVDMGSVDSSNNPLDVSGLVKVHGVTNTVKSSIIVFDVSGPLPAAFCPGLEFTIFFTNIPYARLHPITIGSPPNQLTYGLITIAITNNKITHAPYVYSAILPTLFTDVIQSVTFKSDGKHYNIVSSGPQGWLPAYLLRITLNSFSGVP